MNKAKGAERRKYPRLQHSLPIKVAADGYGFSTSTKNISCLGAYCHINKYIPPFTKVFIKLTLPLRDSAKKNCQIECKGVLVRTEDQKGGGFNIAIFFNDIRDTERKKIAQYINQSLPHAPSLN